LPPPPDVTSLLNEAKRVQQADMKAWARFRFRRTVERHYLDTKGAVADRTTLVLRVTPVTGGFVEELLSIDGRAPSALEIALHRRKGAFAKNYNALVSREGENGSESGFTLRH